MFSSIVKRYFEKGIYSKDNVRTFVKAGRITKEQYTLITGEAY